MEPAAVQRKYLEIQRILGELSDAAPKTQRNKLNWLSLQLLEIKREWIGRFDELDSETLSEINPNEQLQRLSAGRSDDSGDTSEQPSKR